MWKEGGPVEPTSHYSTNAARAVARRAARGTSWNVQDEGTRHELRVVAKDRSADRGQSEELPRVQQLPTFRQPHLFTSGLGRPWQRVHIDYGEYHGQDFFVLIDAHSKRQRSSP